MRIASLILAIFLFMYVNSDKNGFLRQTTRGSGSGNALMSNKTMAVRMPLELKMNSQKYVVTGYPQYVKVRVSGPSAMVTTVSNTQNFKVYADLTKLGVGSHTVTLKESGLNSELRSYIKPKQIKVNIQPRSTITAPVSVRLNSKSVDGNYHVGTPRPAMKTVQITGARNQVKRVTRVIAYVDVPRDAHTNFSRQVTLQAVDKKGRTVNVVVMPSSINVDVPITGQGNTNQTSSSSSSESANSGNNSKDNSSSSSSESSSSSANNND
ncbi:YbbR-like domain-containing protein [uncultured Limosilactobacillus sp.]|uniref:CdaR family protein n=1 Tax=uncultured Limosilactobacillus sp. TaxID=2837629 RepID=UPI0025E9C60D|nr:CdaR family protein [uncultured Limosilactobacillus sp.]